MDRISNFPKNRLILIIFLITSFCFSFIPLDKMSATGYFFDRDQYFDAYLYKNYRLDSFTAEKLIDYFTYEWGWHFLTSYFYNSLGVPVEYFFGFITFLCIFSFGVFILKNSLSWIPLLYLLNPVFLAFAFSQLRLACAMVFFLIFLYFFDKKRYIISFFFLIISNLIHTAIILFFVIFILSKIISKLNNNYIKIISIILSGFLLNILTGPLRETLLSAVGDRRAEYKDMSSPTIYFIFYVVYFFYIIYEDIKYKREYMTSYINNYAFIIFSFTLVSLVFGGYVSRFIAASYSFIVISLFLVKTKNKVFIHCGYTLYLFLLWFTFLT